MWLHVGHIEAGQNLLLFRNNLVGLWCGSVPKLGGILPVENQTVGHLGFDHVIQQPRNFEWRDVSIAISEVTPFGVS